ncbi:MAG: hypothetical protein AAF252_07820, partial [Pseudomonadota bacterium]
GLTDYGAAPRLAQAMADTWQSAAPGVHMNWFYTTRAATPWLASCHVQHVRVVRMTLDASEYAAQYVASADLDGIVAQIADRLTKTEVNGLPLEAHGHDLTAPLLLAAQVPDAVRRQVMPVPPTNTSPDADHIAARLALNRSDLSDDAWRVARKELGKRNT